MAGISVWIHFLAKTFSGVFIELLHYYQEIFVTFVFPYLLSFITMKTIHHLIRMVVSLYISTLQEISINTDRFCFSLRLCLLFFLSQSSIGHAPLFLRFFFFCPQLSIPISFSVFSLLSLFSYAWSRLL